MDKPVFLLFFTALIAASVQAYTYNSEMQQSPVIYSQPRMPAQYSQPVPTQPSNAGYGNYMAANYAYSMPSRQGFRHFEQPALNYYYYFPNLFLQYYRAQTYHYPHYQGNYQATYPPERAAGPYNAGPKEFVVTATDHSFSPRDIEAREGENIKVVFHNYGDKVHTYTVDEIGIDSGLVYPGNSKTIEFTVPRRKNVTLTSYSSVSRDKQEGLSGRIIIR